jgi:hypothetical protein
MKTEKLGLDEFSGPMKQLLDVLVGPSGRLWLEALKRFLRREREVWSGIIFPAKGFDSLVVNKEALGLTSKAVVANENEWADGCFLCEGIWLRHFGTGCYRDEHTAFLSCGETSLRDLGVPGEKMSVECFKRCINCAGISHCSEGALLVILHMIRWLPGTSPEIFFIPALGRSQFAGEPVLSRRQLIRESVLQGFLVYRRTDSSGEALSKFEIQPLISAHYDDPVSGDQVEMLTLPDGVRIIGEQFRELTAP